MDVYVGRVDVLCVELVHVRSAVHAARSLPRCAAEDSEDVDSRTVEVSDGSRDEWRADGAIGHGPMDRTQPWKASNWGIGSKICIFITSPSTNIYRSAKHYKGSGPVGRFFESE